MSDAKPHLSATQLKPRVLSGMRPTGKLHLGNYMGALANWVKLQDEYECYFFIADWHALTTDYADPSRIKQNTVDVALDYLAAGLMPEKSTIFIQSHVIQHAELHLLFSMITPLGWLERVPTYKEQMENIKGKDLTTYGFLGYPLLQAADILLYQPHYVPVGQDQVAHVELTREVARRFNSLYKVEIFPEPDALLTPTAKVPGIDGRKMSKSYGNTIGLTEAPASVREKVQSMSTGGQRIRQTDAGDPTLCPVGDLHKTFSPAAVTEEAFANCRKAGWSCADCRAKAADSVVAVIEPIHNRRLELEANIDETWQMLRDQGAKASARAEVTMREVRETFNISHTLGEVRRTTGETAEDLIAKRRLGAQSEWWTLAAAERTKKLREYWAANIVPFEIQLKEEPNRVFTTIERENEEPLINPKKKRVYVAAAVEDVAGEWKFEVPLKSYEVWALLAWTKDEFALRDFVVPQKYFSQDFARAKKTKPKDGQIEVVLKREGEHYLLSIEGAAAVDVSALFQDFSPLK